MEPFVLLAVQGTQYPAQYADFESAYHFRSLEWITQVSEAYLMENLKNEGVDEAYFRVSSDATGF